MSLKSRARIRQGLRTFKRRSGKYLTVFYDVQTAPSASLDIAPPLKWVFMIPKRSGTAVVRNRKRRLLRETARLWTERHNLSGEFMVRFEPPGRKTAVEAALPTETEYKRELLNILRIVFRNTCES